MAQVVGVGGIFFRSRDPESLGTWYREWLGVPVSHPHGASFEPGAVPRGGFTVWAPFDEETTYFEPSDRQFMVNLIVDDLEGALSQVREGGAEVVGEIEEYEYGRFGWFVDPEGNKVELWQPEATADEASLAVG
ncbi:MAG: VOC family protein [Thermoanaerobaculia bacterium]|nr:VOC family protein [Thermoanaerobaculia bacterium]